MATITWSLKHAVSTDNYQLKNEDGTTTTLDGVITSAVLTATAVDGENTATHPFVNVPLKQPIVATFIPLSELQKEEVLTFALATLPVAVKNNIEASLTARLGAAAQTTTIVFGE